MRAYTPSALLFDDSVGGFTIGLPTADMALPNPQPGEEVDTLAMWAAGEGGDGEADDKVLTLRSVPFRVVRTQYAVRGCVVTKSWELRRQLKEHPGSLPFDDIVAANIGNPQAIGQPPMTFNRQVLSCLAYPPLIDMNPSGYQPDVLERARRYLAAFPNVGAYSHSKGVEVFRKDIAKWFEQRDGIKTDPEHLFLTDGASIAVHSIMELLISNATDGVLIPVPQYPLYSATIARLGGQAVGYFLDEESEWALHDEELERAYRTYTQQGGRIRALVVINPGNPTGSLLSRDKMKEVVRFCERRRIVLIADEVYQDNVYTDDQQFISFRKVIASMGSHLEVFSMHSSSKGLTGECGVRGGIILADNIQPSVLEQLYKLFSISLCANTLGQAMIASILTPPKPEEPSYDTYKAERDEIYLSLRRRACMAYERLNQMEGVRCNPVKGAMYAFPKLTLPSKAIQAARQANQLPDLFYCLQLLQHTGVMVVPGSGFGQLRGSYHFRITILPEENRLANVFDRIQAFHTEFLERYT
uniref:Aminotransferase class I/classII large domain-containing protein n=1 Tax=Vitrella brassicaformis TaxID=1169539 RepID=A0A7S1PEF9_9ALVE|mmetsp:Transcript_8312/g.20307  ORF Transcript_8312/g.20307 Transcript_8312/m.20307 type:complete len:529 (+) Transcript_8312:244-1830(+)